MHLRRQHDLAIAAPARRVHQRLEDQAADPAAAPILQDRHAADVPVGQQAPGSDRKAIAEGHGVERLRIHLVELDLGRHALLRDEHGEADRRGVRARLVPRQELDSEIGVHESRKV
jgi:hypothetical protein